VQPRRPPERLNTYINWEQFRKTLAGALLKEPKGPGGRHPFDYVMMFKILIPQRLYNISGAQAEYQIKDRLSFMRFLGLALCGTLPDEKTIWEYRERLVQAKILIRYFTGLPGCWREIVSEVITCFLFPQPVADRLAQRLRLLG
jgi:hypothetical protein